MTVPISEFRTPRYCIHPYYGFVCTPNSMLDFADTLSPPLGRPAIAHIDAWGFRNRELPAEKPVGETWIGFFGGSVAFSVASSSNETTIAGFLEAALARRAGSGRRIRVINFALPAGQQPQSLLIFATWAPRLDGAVVFDGLNEGLVPGYYNRGAIPVSFPYRPIYGALFARAVTAEQAAIQWWIEREEMALEGKGGSPAAWWEARALRKRIAELKAELKAAPPSEADIESVFPRGDGGMEETVDAGVDNWRDCTRTMHALASARGIEIASVLQPMPERGKPLTAREHANVTAQPEAAAIRRRTYERLQLRAAELEAWGVHCTDFAEVFAAREDDMYVDIGHYSDEACRVVAERIASEVIGDWGCVKGERA